MEKQHFVPRVYLKQFCETNNNLFSTTFVEQTNKWSSIKIRNINSICYDNDFYNLDSKKANKHSIPNDFIERNAFWYEKEYYNLLISEALNGKISNTTIQRLPLFFLNMKARNPVFRNSITKENLNKAIEKSTLSMKEKFSWLDESNLTRIINKSKTIILSSDNIPKEFHVDSLLESTLGRNKVFQEILERISSYNIVFFKISNDNNFFITSDAPGFSIDIEERVHKIKYIDDIFHFMPLHPKLAVGLMNPIYHEIKDQISYIDATKEHIDKINYGTSSSCNKYVFGINDKHLKSVIQNIYPNTP